jgi:hypothetical protein
MGGDWRHPHLTADDRAGSTTVARDHIQQMAKEPVMPQPPVLAEILAHRRSGAVPAENLPLTAIWQGEQQ